MTNGHVTGGVVSAVRDEQSIEEEVMLATGCMVGIPTTKLISCLSVSCEVIEKHRLNVFYSCSMVFGVFFWH